MLDLLISICEPAVIFTLILMLFAVLLWLNFVTIRFICLFTYCMWTGERLLDVLDRFQKLPGAAEFSRDFKNWK